jgi:hypothetical protein
MNDIRNHIDVIAIRKAGIEGWEPYRYERVGSDGSLITGGIPSLVTRGPNKGKKRWKGKGTQVVVTYGEIQAEKQRYASETGNCPECYGKGEIFASWHVDTGTKYEPCPHCDATGKAEREAS